jgi:uncharacterized protein (TIGR02145 family)
MAIAIGHRNGVPVSLGHRGGLSVITRRHGIPFYHPSDIYISHDYIRQSECKIRFTLRGRLTGKGGEYTDSDINGSLLIRFILLGMLNGIPPKVIPKESEKLVAETTFYFYQNGTGKRYQKLVGESWIVFSTSSFLSNITAPPVTEGIEGEATIEFDNEGLMITTSQGYGLLYNYFAAVGIGIGHPISSLINIIFGQTANLTGTQIEEILHGLLYNWYAVDDVRGLANTGWHVATRAEWLDMIDYYGGRWSAAYDLIDPQLWLTYDDWENITNSSKFSAGLGGQRLADGSFTMWYNWYQYYMTATEYDTNDFQYWTFYGGYGELYYGHTDKNNGFPVRLVKDETELTEDGQEGTYTGNDGQSYKSVYINGLEWLTKNLAETEYNSVSIDVSDNFNSYEVGDLSGQGGWVGTNINVYDSSGNKVLGNSGVSYGYVTKSILGFNILNFRIGIRITALSGLSGVSNGGSLYMGGIAGFQWDGTGAYICGWEDDANNVSDFYEFTNVLQEGDLFEWEVTNGKTLKFYINGTLITASHDIEEYYEVSVVNGVFTLNNNYYNQGQQIVTLSIGDATTTRVDDFIFTSLAEDKNIPEVTDAEDWASLTSGALCAYNNDWDNV